jgi:Na+:H+ antiporter, NhaA family
MSMKRPAQSTARLKEFIDHEATGGLLLALAAFVAFVLVNAGFATQYNALLDERVRIGVGALTLDKSLHHFINDGLMAIFFFLVGMEIKREALEGTLVRFSDVLLPAAAALGGIAVPSTIFAWFNWDNAATIGGWAIPAATDIAFALGALALLGVRAPLSLKIFLLTLATFDDLAAGGAVRLQSPRWGTPQSLCACRFVNVGIRAEIRRACHACGRGSGPAHSPAPG